MAKRYQRGNQKPYIDKTDNVMAKRYQRGNQKPYIDKTDNIMAKRKGTKGQTMIYKTLHRKLH
jgi:hypothetical protein